MRGAYPVCFFLSYKNRTIKFKKYIKWTKKQGDCYFINVILYKIAGVNE